MRVTDARVKVVAVLLDHMRALSHQEINELLGPGESLEKVTLYRTLSSLAGCGLISRVVSEDRAWRYQLITSDSVPSQNAYFHCRQCAGRFRLDDKSFRATGVSLPPNYRCEEVEVTLKGTCPQCLAGEKNLASICNLVAFGWLARWLHAEGIVNHLTFI